MKTFKEALKILALIMAILFFGAGFIPKCSKKVPAQVPSKNEVVKEPQQCMEHLFNQGCNHMVEAKKTVVVLEGILPPPPPCGVQEININQLTVQTQIINSDTEVRKPKLQPLEIVEEPIQQGALMEYTDRSGGHAEVRSYYGGTYYYSGGWNNHHGGGGNWNSYNAQVRIQNPAGHGRNTQGCSW